MKEVIEDIVIFSITASIKKNYYSSNNFALCRHFNAIEVLVTLFYVTRKLSQIVQ